MTNKVIIADQDIRVAETTRNWVEPYTKYKIECTDSREKLIEMAGDYSLALVGCSLEDIRDYPLLSKIRKVNSELKVYLMSDGQRLTDNQIKKALEVGAVGYLDTHKGDTFIKDYKKIMESINYS
jgi:response regulator of citrate/malate metabolism